MATTIELNLDSVNVSRQLEKLASSGQDLSPVMREIAGILADTAEQAFSDEADPSTGTSWKPLTESHKARRREKGYTGSILSMTGQLASSIQAAYGSGYAQVGSNLIYAAIHQHGGTEDMRPSAAAIPARPFLGMGSTDQDEIMSAIERYLRDTLS